MIDIQTTLKKINIVILTISVCALTVLACLLVYRYDNKYTSPGPRAVEGVLQLDELALEQYPILMLVDGWEIYTGMLLTPQDFDRNPPKPFEYIFIGQFGGFDLGYTETPPHGSATYRLCIQLPDKPKTYMLELPEIFSAYRLYINGTEAAVMGEPSPQSYLPALGNRTVSFEAENSIELIFAVSDFTHFYSGMVYPPAFGEPTAVSSLLNARLVFRSVLCSIVIAVGLLSLLIAALSKKTSFERKALKSHSPNLQISAGEEDVYFAYDSGARMRSGAQYRHDVSPERIGSKKTSFERKALKSHSPGLIFAFLCLCFVCFAGYPVIRTFVSGYYPWYALENISYNAMLAAVMLLQTMICGITGASRRLPIYLGLFVCLAAIIAHATLPIGNLRLMLAYSSLLTVYVWLFAVFITFTSLRAVISGTVNSKPLLCGALIFDCAMVMDRLLPLHEPIITGWFHELAGFMLVITIGIAIGRELAAGYREAAVLREREDALEKLAGMQQSYYQVLEEKATEVNSTRHDLRHHYMIIAGFIKDRRYAELEAYISESLTITDESGPRIYCSNNIVNVLANHYAQTAKQNGIQFEMRCDVEGEFRIPDSDLCGILGNLFENAVDACLRIDTGDRFIKVGITGLGSLLTIRFWNSTNEDVRQFKDGFLSSKRESGFGYGLESVRSIAERHSGEARFFWNKAERTFDSKVTLSIRK